MHGKTPPHASTRDNTSDPRIDAPTRENPNDPRLYSSREARKLLGGISETTFRKLVISGELPARRRGRHIVIPRADLARYIDELPKFVDDDQGPVQAS